MEIHTLDLNFCNLRHAIASYLVVGSGGPVLVETGPVSTVDTLTARLAERGFAPEDVRHVLVTHIHLDHAGAAGWWARQGAQVYVHHFGAPHLVDPSRLLASASRVYGDMLGILWGKIVPAPAARVTALQDGDRIEAGGMTFTALDAPGHARHHLVYVLDSAAFTGDAAGIRMPGSDFIHLPTPPPELDPPVWRATMGRLLEARLETIYPTHFGPVDAPVAHIEAARALLDQTVEFVGERLESGMERDEIVKQYTAWNRERAAAQGVGGAELVRYECINPATMSADGIIRYWRKSRDSQNSG